MLISIEGPLGVGKSTLVTFCSHLLQCQTVYEDVERNPFLPAFYSTQDRSAVAKHVQYTFLFLQEWQWRQALLREQQGKLVVCDFHPMKSLIFSKVILSPREQDIFSNVYTSLSIQQADLIVYLKADEHTILSRLRKRQDQYRDEIDLSYVIRVCSAYDSFFKSYTGPYITIETSQLDYYTHPHDIQVPLQSMQAVFDISSYYKGKKIKEVWQE